MQFQPNVFGKTLTSIGVKLHVWRPGSFCMLSVHRLKLLI